MKELMIFGAGGFGREVFAYARDSGLRVAGFVDENSSALEGFDLEVGLVGNLDSISKADEFSWLVAVGDASARQRVSAVLLGRGAQLASVIHPTAYVAPSAHVGPGAIICPFAMIGANAQVSSNVAINAYASVGHDAVVGRSSVFSPYSTVNGNVTLGSAVFLGSGAIVLPGCSVGAYSKIAAGAVVTRDMGPGSLVVGNPAKGRVMFAVGND
jgi:sugar O-acyltransferase (sialic acid O-acetyltransferase NeuD family)